jgi:hypothetical protein
MSNRPHAFRSSGPRGKAAAGGADPCLAKGPRGCTRSMRYLITASLALATLVGCVTVKRSVTGRTTRNGGRLVMIYGGGSSAPHESQSEIAERWMTIHVTQSDSTYEFGHITRDGFFDVYCTGLEGRFRIQGGEVRHFAIRDSASAVHHLQGSGTYTLAGPAMSPAKAIFPRMEKPYYSIARLTFKVARDSSVTVELVASSPNGFGRAD